MWQHNISGSLSPIFTLLLPSPHSGRWPSSRFLSQRRDVTGRGRERRVSSWVLVPETALRRKKKKKPSSIDKIFGGKANKDRKEFPVPGGG